MKSPMFYWDPDTGIAKVVITAEDGSIHTGTAKCHDSDRDVLSEFTGCGIAERRAVISCLKHTRDYIIKPKLKTLQKFLYVVNQSKYFNNDEYVSRMLYKEIARAKYELEKVKKDIAEKKQELKTYITKKQEMQAQYRKK